MSFDARRLSRSQESKDLRKHAESQFDAARALASQHGMTLAKHSDVHYTLYGHYQAWQKNIYPGNCRLYSSDDRGPYLSLSIPWTLLDVVEAAMEAIAKETRT